MWCSAWFDPHEFNGNYTTVFYQVDLLTPLSLSQALCLSVYRASTNISNPSAESMGGRVTPGHERIE
jgi:hypothetical protein